MISSFSDPQIVQIIGDLFTAGTETTATTLKWALVYMLNHPDIQEKVHNEIFDVIGLERPPTMRDKPNLPYTEACVLETQRMALGVPHANTEDIIFRGYHIPKGTTIMSNLYSVHRNPSVWDKPYEFNPERFLDEDGTVHRREQIIPFSMGRFSYECI